MVVNDKMAEDNRPNILYIMCDQLRFDCISALGNGIVRTPNLDRLVKRGASYVNAYSTCPVCVPARYTIMTGREPGTTGCYANEDPRGMDGLPQSIEERCGSYLPRVMARSGYRTFGLGKFHTKPDCYEDLGFECHRHTEELWATPEIRQKDAYAGYILANHPEYAHIEQLHGERTNMYYVPQMSPLPERLTVESFVAAMAVEQISQDDGRPFFGFVSFIGPHPPCAPPLPYNRMYDPDLMPEPVAGDPDSDSLDEQIRFMNHAIWADDIRGGPARNLISRYYGEISYIDACLGRILDAVEARADANSTLICFFSDHGDHLGDHGAWQKETFFESSARIPFLVSAPGMIPANVIRHDLVCLADLFAIATHAGGTVDRRDGIDLLAGETRECIFGIYGRPGTNRFKIMIRSGRFKYIFMANGGREQLFDLEQDPGETVNLANSSAERIAAFRQEAARHCGKAGLRQALSDDCLNVLPDEQRPLIRIHQFEFSAGIEDFEQSSGHYVSAM